MAEVVAGARMHLGQVFLEREQHIVGAERLAVVPGHAFLQLEGIGQAIGRYAPRLGKAGLGIKLEIIGQQALVDLAADDLGRRLLVQAQHQDGRLGIQDDVERAAMRLRHGRRACAESGCACQQDMQCRFSEEHSVAHDDSLACSTWWGGTGLLMKRLVILLRPEGRHARAGTRAAGGS
ncbi:hypothetical protein G6F57_020667 [Rhizopus arrhizus]|nr:hypothetical protein G6F57_020667 [Rhizopus arrhizus]